MYGYIKSNKTRSRLFRKSLWLVGFLFCLSGQLKAQTAGIMTYNIRLDVASDGENRWDNRKEIFAGQIKFYDPMVLGLQEALPNQVAYLDTNLQNYHHIGQGRDGGYRGEACVIFYDTTRLTLLQQKTFWLSETPAVVSKGWDASYIRICTYGLFSDIKTKKRFWVFNTHLDNNGALARKNGISLILQEIKTVNTENLPVIVMGDFNDTPGSEPVATIKQVMSDARDVSTTKPFGPSGTFNNFEFDKPVTFLIDYIFVSKGDEITVTKHAVLSDSYNRHYPSDHLPVYIQVVFKPGTSKAPAEPAAEIWSKPFTEASIVSSADKQIQKAWFYPTTQQKLQPLIISLHTWSGDYNQADPLAAEALLRDWNYIHPDFRGPNIRPEACASDLVMADLEDAIAYAISHGHVDPANVHIVGVSGGGYATLAAYMRLKYPVKSFNAWVPISDLTSWYYESIGRKQKYAGDVEKVMTKNGAFDMTELTKRSPIKMKYPAALRKNTVLNIYTGVHDGYTGSVPISQSMLFYNRIVKEVYPGDAKKLVPDSVIQQLLSRQTSIPQKKPATLGGRLIHLQKSTPLHSLTIFEGGHEMLPDPALVLPPIDKNKTLKPFTILTIGDSNGAADDGWPVQLQKLAPYSSIVNKSVSGNTIGFDNNGQTGLNTITNINRYLKETGTSFSAPDYIFICLGTNDTKAVFKDRQNEVVANLQTLIEKIKAYYSDQKLKVPAICFITPAPVDQQKAETPKYDGCDDRIRQNNESFKAIAARNQIGFISCYDQLKAGIETKTKDGVHLTARAQFELASCVITYINQNTGR